MDTQYESYADSRLSGEFGEMSSWRFVYPYIKGKRTLDIGCSDGLYLRHLTSDSQGLEQVPALANAGKASGLDIICGDIHESITQIADLSFEAALFSHVMEHVDSPIVMLRHINRILKDQGILVLGLPTERNVFRDLLRMDYYDGTHIYAFTIRNARKLLEETGFEVQEIYYHLPKCRSRLGMAIESAWNNVKWPFREYFSMAYWVVAKKSRELKGAALQ